MEQKKKKMKSLGMGILLLWNKIKLKKPNTTKQIKNKEKDKQ